MTLCKEAEIFTRRSACGLRVFSQHDLRLIKLAEELLEWNQSVISTMCGVLRHAWQGPMTLRIWEDQFPVVRFFDAVGKVPKNVKWTFDKMLGERNHFGWPTIRNAAKKEPTTVKRKLSVELPQIKHSWKPKKWWAAVKLWVITTWALDLWKSFF